MKYTADEVNKMRWILRKYVDTMAMNDDEIIREYEDYREGRGAYA